VIESAGLWGWGIEIKVGIMMMPDIPLCIMTDVVVRMVSYSGFPEVYHDFDIIMMESRRGGIFVLDVLINAVA
jgi:hypothetical protein